MNKCIFMGRLTKDVELKGEGEKIRGTFSIAVNKYSKDNQSSATFVPCVAFGKKAEIISKYFYKGKPIIVETHVDINKVEKDGKTTFYTNFIVDQISFIPENKNKNESKSSDSTPVSASSPVETTNDGFMNIDDEDLPWA